MQTRLKLFILVSILFFISNRTEAQSRIITIGDSTMSDYDEKRYSDQRGWVQMLPAFLKDSIKLINAARAGRSSKSFYYEFWPELRDSIKSGDYIFIQFGHNDEKNGGVDSKGYGKEKLGTAAWGQYQEYLKKYVKESRDRGAIPIFFTSIVRGKFDEQDKLTDESIHSLKRICGNDSLMNYPLAMRSLAKELDVPLVDMTAFTKKIIESYGYEKAKKYIYCKKDDTHLKATGGILFSKLAVEELIRQKLLNNFFLY